MIVCPLCHQPAVVIAAHTDDGRGWRRCMCALLNVFQASPNTWDGGYSKAPTVGKILEEGSTEMRPASEADVEDIVRDIEAGFQVRRIMES